MTTQSSLQEREWLDVFNAAAALYSALKDNERSFRIKRAEIKQDGEVFPDPIDYCIDFELKTCRALPWMEAQMSLRIISAGNADILPRHIKQDLGHVLAENNMGVEGAYRKLYFREKIKQDAQAMKGINSEQQRHDV
jgi:hypothetical protein